MLGHIGHKNAGFEDLHNGMLVATQRMTASQGVDVTAPANFSGKYSRYYFERKVEWKNE